MIMSETSANNEAGQFFTMATSIKPRPLPHPFVRLPFSPRDDLAGRHEQHERKCQVCSLFKITVIPREGEARRKYRYGETGPQFQADADPACGGVMMLEFSGKE